MSNDIPVPAADPINYRNDNAARTIHLAIFASLAVALAIAPFVLYPIFVMKVMCFALFTCSFNLLFGYGGMLSFGHAAFFGMGSYFCAYFAKKHGLPTELALGLGTLAAALLSVIGGLLAIRRQGIYFAMITLATAQMIFFIAVQTPYAGGEDGIQSVPRGKLFGQIDLANTMSLYVTVAVLFIAALLVYYRIIHSPFGRVLRAIRDNETRAISLGYHVNRYKLMLFVLSGTLAGLAGAMKCIVFQLASLTDVHWSLSGEVVIMTLVGGMGTIFGPVLGALILVGMQNYLATFGDWVMIIQGIVLFACVMTFRKGILGVIASRLKLRL
jgi:branched-chain amino acid transport system permease protein